MQKSIQLIDRYCYGTIEIGQHRYCYGTIEIGKHRYK